MIGEARKLQGLHEPPLHFTVLASRAHLCGEARVASSPNVSTECRRLLASTLRGGSGCSLEQKVPQLTAALAAADHPLLDVEELAARARAHHACAFFTARMEARDADVIVCPYNYVLEPAVRAGAAIQLQHGDVLLFDEGHNLPDMARSAASLRLGLPLLVDLANQLTTLACTPAAEFVARLADWLRGAAATLAPEDFSPERNAWRGPALEALLLRDWALSPAAWRTVQQSAAPLLHATASPLTGDASLTDAAAQACSALLSTFGALFSSPSAFEHFAVVVKRTREQQPELALLCLWAGVVLRPLASVVRAVVLASGSLAPFESLSGELGLHFTVRAQAPHVVPRTQLFFGTISFGVNGTPLELSFKAAEALATQDELGATLLALARTSPHGMLCFVPSYGLLRRLHDRWLATALLTQLRAAKRLFWEAPDARAFDAELAEYYAAAQRAPGALFMGVCRGKLSEGLNCADWRARLVVVAGVPFPALHDEAVLLKRAYNSARGPAGGLADGNSWYTAQAAAAAAQAVGRVVRHAGDWGAVLLIDARFRDARLAALFPTWLSTASTAPSSIASASQLLPQLSSFFARHLPNAPPTPPPSSLSPIPLPTNAPASNTSAIRAFPTLPPARPVGAVVLRPRGRSAASDER